MDIGGWLRGLGLGQYETAFRENEIDADVLSDLTELDLEKAWPAAWTPQASSQSNSKSDGESGFGRAIEPSPTTGCPRYPWWTRRAKYLVTYRMSRRGRRRWPSRVWW